MQFGAKVKSMRTQRGVTQAQLAAELGISASYLNLIEHDRRPLTANVLIKLVKALDVDLAQFESDVDERLVLELQEVFGDLALENHVVPADDIREFARTLPGVADAVVALYQRYQNTQTSLTTVASQVTHNDELVGVDVARLPTEEVNDFVQRHLNYFPQLEEHAEDFWRKADLDEDDVYRGLHWFLEKHLGVQVRIDRSGERGHTLRRFDRTQRVLYLSELLPPRSRNFQMAHQAGMLLHYDDITQLTDDVTLTNPVSRSIARVVLANYFAAAVLMPYDKFHEAAIKERYDIELLGHRFRAGFEQICHRLTTLRRKGRSAIPFHMLRIDIAGNISKRFSASGIRFARFSGVCPRWDVCLAFLTPGMIRVQVSQMPDGATFFCVARTISKRLGGYPSTAPVHAVGLGCEISHARHLVYADGVDLDNVQAAVPVGVTCRLCDRLDCEQRAFPPLHHPLTVDEDSRGVSFYAPTPSSGNGQQPK
ncbi:MAG: DUF2083 domain-containing protein [Myxococcales bacterium]|nr:DUF2083 domain-containing protein [Myxococcales bacterium]